MHGSIVICIYSDASRTYCKNIRIRISGRRMHSKTQIFTCLDARGAEGGRGGGSNGQTEKGERERRRKERVREKEKGRKRERGAEREGEIDVGKKKNREREREEACNQIRISTRLEALMTRGSPGSAFGHRATKCPLNTHSTPHSRPLLNTYSTPPPIWGTYSVPAPAPGAMTTAEPQRYSRAASCCTGLSDVRVRS